MFYYLKGKIVYKFENFVVLDIGGVGYKVFASDKTISALNLYEEQTLFTYTNIKEDLFDIYGFISKEELDLFNQLLSVNGVGPKAGLAILSVLSVSELMTSIVSGDAKAISSAPGIGTKTAQRIILELKGKIDMQDVTDSIMSDAKNHSNIDATVEALTALGYNAQQAKNTASFVESGNVEQMIKDALKILSQGKF